LPGIVLVDFGVNMTSFSSEIHDLHVQALWMITVIGMIVFGIMIRALVSHRKSTGADTARFHYHPALEIVWASIPVLILVACAFPATRTLLAIEAATDTEMTIRITGYQWRWHYDYLDEEFGFFSSPPAAPDEARQQGETTALAAVNNDFPDVDNPMVIPVNTRVHLLTTANDVIHLWGVQDLGWKRDAVPDFINDNYIMVTREGTYRGQGSELCGKDHAYMPIVLQVVSAEDYRKWADAMLLDQQRAAEGAAEPLPAPALSAG
jgi:cytochrome c oxidase subunit 2